MSLEDAAFMGEASGGSVHHPKHYNAHRSGVECIDVIELLPGNLANAVKYAWRCGEKGAHLEDLKKSAWYLEREIARVEADPVLPERWPWPYKAGHLCDKVFEHERLESVLGIAMACTNNAMCGAVTGLRQKYINNLTLFLTRVRKEIEIVG